jgi:hypothetical protein
MVEKLSIRLGSSHISVCREHLKSNSEPQEIRKLISPTRWQAKPADISKMRSGQESPSNSGLAYAVLRVKMMPASDRTEL